MKCEICGVDRSAFTGKLFKDLTSIGCHLRSHKVAKKDYYDKYLKTENEGVCLICGKQTSFGYLNTGYSMLCSSRSCQAKYNWNNENYRINQSKTAFLMWKKTSHRVKTLKSMSESASKRIIDGTFATNNGRNHITGRFLSQKNNCDIYYASSYELRAYEILEQLSVVKSFGRCKFFIDYMNPVDTQMHKYIPDVLVEYNDGSKQIIEVKPANRLEDETVMAKASAAQMHCDANNLNYTIWTEKDLN